MTGKKIESEKVVERKLAEAVRREGGVCIKMLSDYLTGLPDRLCLFPGGRAAFVELKTTGEKPRRIQTLIHRRLRALGFEVAVIDTVEGIGSFITKFKGYDN